jgi:hypothetical protein
MKDKPQIKVVCFCCNKELEATLTENEPPSMISGGLICYTHGNFGSTVFDPVYGDYRLVFYVCDACMTARKEKVLHVKYEQHLSKEIIDEW